MLEVMTTILVVEDELRIRQFVVTNLRVRGYSVLEAGSAEDGLALLDEHRPAGMILDLKLPGMSGIDLLEKLTDRPSEEHIPVIVMSAYPANKPIEDIGYPLVVERLPKPLSVTELISAVRENIG
jgi:tubulin-specific chaperone A